MRVSYGGSPWGGYENEIFTLTGTHFGNRLPWFDKRSIAVIKYAAEWISEPTFTREFLPISQFHLTEKPNPKQLTTPTMYLLLQWKYNQLMLQHPLPPFGEYFPTGLRGFLSNNLPFLGGTDTSGY